MEKILSVIIPTYNMEALLDRCLKSLCLPKEYSSQIEVLVINDGSKDNSLEIACKYSELYPDTFVVKDKVNGNYGSCVNAGLEIATGKYITVLDADDYLDTNNLCDFVKLLSSISCDLVLSDVEINYESGEKKSRHLPIPENNVTGIDKLNDETINRLFIHHITYNRKLLSGYKQTEGISYTDLEWTTIPMSKAKNMYYFPHNVYHYILGRDEQTVAPVKHAKNMWMEKDVAMNVVDFFYGAGKAEIVPAHTEKKISFIVENLYNYYLLSLAKYTDQNEIVEFDKKLKEKSEKIYRITDDHSIQKFKLKFHFIREWRKNYSRKHPMFTIYDLRSK